MKHTLRIYTLVVTASMSILTAQQPDADAMKLGSITISGSIHERYEAWNWFPTKGQSTYGFSGSLLRLDLSQQTSSFDWNFELAAPILLGLPNRAVLPAPQGQLGLGGNYYAANHNDKNAAFIFPKQGYVRFKGEKSSMQLGRFEFVDGTEVTRKDPTLATLIRDRIAHRLIGTFAFADVQRSVDGLRFGYNNGSWNITAVSAVPDRGVFQVDGWGWVVTPFSYVSATHQNKFGNSLADWRVFGIYYHDDRGVLKTDNRSAAAKAKDLASIDIGTYGGHYIQEIPTSAGTFDLLGWGALQSGRWGVLTQRSGAGDVEGGWQPTFASPLKPWIRAGYFYSSGDGNPNDGTHGTFFAILPTARIYARFPFFNEMNNRDLFAELMLRPSKKLTLRSDAHELSLANKNDLWYTGGGAFQPWTFGFNGRTSSGATGLADLYDISADYQATKGMALTLYYGYAHGRAVIDRIYPGQANGSLGYVEVNYRF
jgi:hypothetical protein